MIFRKKKRPDAKLVEVVTLECGGTVFSNRTYRPENATPQGVTFDDGSTVSADGVIMVAGGNGDIVVKYPTDAGEDSGCGISVKNSSLKNSHITVRRKGVSIKDSKVDNSTFENG